MRIPNFIDSQFANKEGFLTDTWRQILTQLFTELQKNTSVEGLVFPTQTTANITTLGPQVPFGSLLYDKDTKQPKVNVEGVFKVMQTAGNDFNEDVPGLSYDDLTGTLSLDPGYDIPTTAMEAVWNSKEPGITPGTSLQYWRGDKTWQTLNTAAVPELTNLYYLDSRARLALSSSATGLTYTNTTGDFSLTSGYVIPTTTEESNWNDAYSKRVSTWNSPLNFSSNTASIQVANSTQNGYLSSTDWTTFNSKQNALTNPITGTGTSGQYAEFNGTTTITGVTKNTAFNANFETSTANIKPNGTVNVGALSTVPCADHIHGFSATLPLSYNAATGNISLGSRSVFISAETNGLFNNYRTRSVGASGNFNFDFFVPSDFSSLIACYVQGFVSAGAATTNRNIDIDVQYNSGSGQLYNQLTASDTTTVYNLTGLTNRLFNLPVTSLLTNLVAGSVGGIKVTHTTIGGSIDYIGVLLIYV